MWHHRKILLNQFWKRWTHDYLLYLQPFRKWRKDYPVKVEKGTLVLIREDNMVRGQWILGLVLGGDGRIRACVVKTAKGIVRRHIHRLAPLECPSGQYVGEIVDNRADWPDQANEPTLEEIPRTPKERTAVSAPKRRGRPRKVETPTVLPRPRGRPRKIAREQVESPRINGELSAQVAAPRGRGRPRKATSEKAPTGSPPSKGRLRKRNKEEKRAHKKATTTGELAKINPEADQPQGPRSRRKRPERLAKTVGERSRRAGWKGNTGLRRTT